MIKHDKTAHLGELITPLTAEASLCLSLLGTFPAKSCPGSGGTSGSESWPCSTSGLLEVHLPWPSDTQSDYEAALCMQFNTHRGRGTAPGPFVVQGGWRRELGPG